MGRQIGYECVQRERERDEIFLNMWRVKGGKIEGGEGSEIVGKIGGRVRHKFDQGLCKYVVNLGIGILVGLVTNLKFEVNIRQRIFTTSLNL